MAPRRPKFRKRFHAWWEGYDPADEVDDDEPLLLDTPAPPELDPVPPDDPTKAWPQRRIDAAQLIWGRDFIAPGGAALTVELAKPFSISPSTNFLDMHAGLGGGTRAIATMLDCWVTGLEADPDLAAEGHLRSRALMLDRKAPIKPYDLENFELKLESFDFVLARECFYRVVEKERLLLSIYKGLKPRGQLSFTDILLAQPKRTSPALERWMAADRQRPRPWAVDDAIGCLTKLDFDLRIREDITPIYRGHVMAAFLQLVRNIANKSIRRAQLVPVLEEAERWARRMAAIDAGDLVVYRFFAIKQR